MLDADAAAADTPSEAEFTPTQTAAVTKIFRQAAEKAGYVTGDQFKAGLAEVRAETAQLDKRLSTQIAEHDARQSKQTAESRAEIAELRGEMRERFADLRALIAQHAAEQSKRHEQLDKQLSQQIAALKVTLVRWAVWMLLTGAALAAAILRFFGS